MTEIPALRSSLFEGVVTHHRHAPEHRFTQRVAMPLLFTDELARASRLHPLVHLDPTVRPSGHHAMRLVRSDFLSPHGVPLEQAVAGEVAAAGGSVSGPVGVLGHVRTWGWLFNPITCYFCFDERGLQVEWTVLEVTNTPWHERHAYVLGPPGRHRLDKVLHVSPFLPPEAVYDIRYTAPGADCSVSIDVMAADGGERLLTASMRLRRRPLDRRSLDHLLWRTPAMTARVSAGIYGQAARLAVRGATFHPHPARRSVAGTGSPHG